MSKISNDGLTRSGTHRMLHSCIHMATVGVEGLKHHQFITHHQDASCRKLIEPYCYLDSSSSSSNLTPSCLTLLFCSQSCLRSLEAKLGIWLHPLWSPR